MWSTLIISQAFIVVVVVVVIVIVIVIMKLSHPLSTIALLTMATARCFGDRSTHLRLIVVVVVQRHNPSPSCVNFFIYILISFCICIVVAIIISGIGCFHAHEARVIDEQTTARTIRSTRSTIVVNEIVRGVRILGSV